MAMMAASAAPQVSRYGLTQVYAPIGGGLVDVVFVHGLNGKPDHTWTSERSKIFWPAQLLPPILNDERARILVYGYDADVTSFTDGVSTDKIHNHAEHLVAELVANRRIRKASERPIIFVAHSLGGLVVKRALIYSSEIRGIYTEHLRSIYVSTFGILFLGTPHKGSDVAEWGSRLEWICSVALPSKLVDTQPQLVDALKKNNETLQNIDRQFIQLMNRFHVYFFHEGKPTNLKGTLKYIVDEVSASPTVQDVERASIQADHSHMCKFESDGAPGFDLVAEGIQRYAGEAPAIISGRWDEEKKARLAQKQAAVEELIPGSLKATPQTDSSSTNSSTPDTSQILPPKDSHNPPQLETSDTATNTPASPTKPTEPYFIVPPGFRPNTFYVGMEKEFQDLDRRLFDKRRRDGTACVLLHGQPGSGKSHLARQYVNKNRKKFGGGVFWITAKSKEERYHAFWNLKQKVICRDKPELCDGINGNDFVSVVKAWFEGRQEWLMVFDGVTVEKDEDTTDLASFVPDSRNSSIIYISRAKNLESKQRLLRPFPIKVGPLKVDDAKKLLFKELHIKRPTEAEERKAIELVRNIGGLPLAIDAISHRLADTHEPLTKYKLSYSADPTIEGTYNKILDDLQRLGHMEAWNLIHILCWFGHEIPVEMVHLGLRILRTGNVEVRATETGGRPDINTTFGELMRYALIERNEPDDMESMSSSRNSLVDPEPIDMLRIHSVVQNFCCDSLNSRGLLPEWLGYAVDLFSFSYHQADIKIKQRPDTARVSDYRYYKVHGQRLWDHSVHYESKTQDLGSIREVLQPKLSMIDDEIRQHEPSSSQESLKNGIFQISIFDRTSSSSDSGPGPITPDHRPTPPPLDNETLFGFPKGKTSDSPGSFDAASVGIRPRIVGLSPRLPTLDDIGYESEQEGQRTSRPMQHNLSDHTARPSPRSPAPSSAESHDEGWQVVPSAKKPRKSRGRRDLGNFRPTTAKPQIDQESVTGSVALSDTDGRQAKETSPAFRSLKKVQSRSPPPSRNGIASFFQRGPLGPPATTVTQPTWAGIAAGRAGQPPQQGSAAPISGTAGRPAAPMMMERGRSRESLRSRRGGAQSSPSPLGSEFVPHRGSSAGIGEENIRASEANPTYTNEYPPAGFQYTTPYPGSNSSLTQIPQGRPIEGTLPYYTPPPMGPNRDPLPVEESITITTKRPLPPDLREQPPSPFFPPPGSHHPSQPQNRTSPHQPHHQVGHNAPYPPPVMPAIPKGYYSQPMSRNHSDQSHGSAAETDPARYPSDFSPQITPADPLRERHPDGRAFRKSPKTDFAQPIYSAHSSPRISPHDLSHAGGWAYSSPSHSAPDPHDLSMSRSSSGPGVAVSDAPGGIVRFDSAGSVQFGEHVPISVEEARRRTREHEVRLRERMGPVRGVDGERWVQRRDRGWEKRRNGGRGQGQGQDGEGEGRRESAPYPEDSLIPTEEGVLGRGRPRGLSAPGMDEVVGLGLHFG